MGSGRSSSAYQQATQLADEHDNTREFCSQEGCDELQERLNLNSIASYAAMSSGSNLLDQNIVPHKTFR